MNRRRRETPGKPLGELLRGDHLVEPPRDTLARALALGELLPRPTGVKAWVATLVFDSSAQPLPAGVRSAGSVERCLAYDLTPGGGTEGATVPPHRLDLRLRRTPDGSYDLVGQLEPPWPSATVEAGTGRRRRTGPLRSAGEFVLRDVRPKTGEDGVRLTIRSGDGAHVEVVAVPLPEEIAGP